MLTRGAPAILIGAVLAVTAQTPPDAEELLARTRDKVLDRTRRLPNYICVQTADRQYLKREKPEFPVPSCDQMSGERTRKAYRLKLEATDRLRLDVKVSGGTEIAAWAGSSHFEDGDVMKLAMGPFGTGPLGTFLTDIFTADAQFYFQGEELINNLRLFRFGYRISRGTSHYMVQAGNEWVYTGYDGDIWIDPDSRDVKRLIVRIKELPEEADACESSTVVDYATAQIGTGNFLMPMRSELHFLMRDTTENDVAITYSGCHEFVGEAKLVTDPAAVKNQPPPAPRVSVSIPPGVVIPLKLAEPIDTGAAAAGDIVITNVAQAIRDPRSKEQLIPAHSVVRARIVGMRHWLDSPPRFVISLQLESVEIDGVVSPIYARLLRGDELAGGATSLPGRRNPIFLNPLGRLCPVANHVVYTRATRYVMPRGYEMKWVTVPPPDNRDTRLK